MAIPNNPTIAKVVMVKLLDNFDPIVGDDLGHHTTRYNKVPSEYGFKSLQSRESCPLTKEKWADLIDFAERYYSKFEIVGETFQDFKENLQLFYDKNADTFERQLEVYNDDIAKPILGRTEKTTYNLANNDAETVAMEGESSDTGNGQNSIIDVPIDASNPNSQTPSQIDTSEQTNTGTNSSETNRNLEHKQTGTVETELSDLGVRPNYESLNGFLDNNRTYYDVFVWLFRDCFQLNDYLIW